MNNSSSTSPPTRHRISTTSSRVAILLWSRRCGKPRARRAAISTSGAHGAVAQPSSQATVAAAHEVGRPAQFVAAADVGETLPDDEGLLLTADDVDALGDAAQAARFRQLQPGPAMAKRFCLSGDAPPLQLRLREDLRARIVPSLVFGYCRSPTRSARILHGMAARRGLRLDPGRGIPAAPRPAGHARPRRGRQFLDAGSLEQKRPVTLPLLRELMQRGLDI